MLTEYAVDGFKRIRFLPIGLQYSCQWKRSVVCNRSFVLPTRSCRNNHLLMGGPAAPAAVVTRHRHKFYGGDHAQMSSYVARNEFQTL
jgi:hypothetical protein